MEFRRGDRVEVASKEDGFVGSNYAATVISDLMKKSYIVQYANLLKEDESGPLREVVAPDEVRPPPPEIPMTTGFGLHDRVDAFDNDGWWVGKITGRMASSSYYYYVYFETTGDEIAYPLNRLRVHQDWMNGKWVSSKERVGSMRFSPYLSAALSA